MLRFMKALFRRLRHRSEWEREMQEELQFHIEARTADLIKAGVDGNEAARRSLIEFGGYE